MNRNSCGIIVALIGVFGLLSCASPPEADPQAIASLSAAQADERMAIIKTRAQTHSVSSAAVTHIEDTQVRSYYVGDADEIGLFQAASLSKAVAAAGILTLMEREDIDIDADIRNRFTSIAISDISEDDEPLTVRQLLSHTAGATQGGYPGYRRGQALPSSAEIVTDPPNRLVNPVKLNGKTGQFRYSGGGYQIAQLLAEDISGQPFTELMDALIFTPLGMDHSTFAQPIDPTSRPDRHIVPANSGIRMREGLFRPLKDSWHNYPEMAAAGLWTTSADYARFVQALLDAARDGTGPISATIAANMLRPTASGGFLSETQGYGLGVMLELGPDGEVVSFSHSGLNAGYRALFAAHPGQNVIITAFSNAPGRAAFNTEMIEGLAPRP